MLHELYPPNIKIKNNMITSLRRLIFRVFSGFSFAELASSVQQTLTVKETMKVIGNYFKEESKRSNKIKIMSKITIASLSEWS